MKDFFDLIFYLMAGGVLCVISILAVITDGKIKKDK